MKYKHIFLSEEYFLDQFTYPLRSHAKLKNVGKAKMSHALYFLFEVFSFRNLNTIL